MTTPDPQSLLDRIRDEVREAVLEGDAQGCQDADCIADAVYEIVRVRLMTKPDPLRAALDDPGDGLREASARELFDDVANDEHGQLCPIWTQRANKTHKPAWTDCNCWQLRRVRRQAALALGAPLVRGALAADPARDEYNDPIAFAAKSWKAKYETERALRLAPDTARPGLDAAWAEAEAALPRQGLDFVELVKLGADEWRAIADIDLIDSVGEDAIDGRGPTPADALRALTARLTEDRP